VIHIGQLIKSVVEKSGKSHKDFAGEIPLTYQALFKLYGRDNIETDQLRRVGKLLNYDFFRDLAGPDPECEPKLIEKDKKIEEKERELEFAKMQIEFYQEVADAARIETQSWMNLYEHLVEITPALQHLKLPKVSKDPHPDHIGAQVKKYLEQHRGKPNKITGEPISIENICKTLRITHAVDWQITIVASPIVPEDKLEMIDRYLGTSFLEKQRQLIRRIEEQTEGT